MFKWFGKARNKFSDFFMSRQKKAKLFYEAVLVIKIKAFLRLVRVALLTVLAMALLAVGIFAFNSWYYQQRVFWGVHFAGLDLSNLTFAEAEFLLASTLDELQKSEWVATYQDQSWPIEIPEWGIDLQAGEYLDLIKKYGRHDNLWQQFNNQIDIYYARPDIHPGVDPTAYSGFFSWLDLIKLALEVPTVDAKLTFLDDQVIIEPQQTGQEILTALLISEITNGLNQLEPIPVSIQTRQTLPRVLADDLEDLSEQAYEWVGQKIVMDYDLHVWDIFPDELQTWLGSAYDEDNQTAHLTM
ncbi:MAG TPA: hypothetical protein ENN77_00840, partial [Candidatus Wirthbacteria bacterium]|nr:hypothetical protein [Candidatus Wirthbacteria bacterium]